MKDRSTGNEGRRCAVQGTVLPVRAGVMLWKGDGLAVHGRNPFRTTLKPWLQPLFVGIYRGSESSQALFGGAN